MNYRTFFLIIVVCLFVFNCKENNKDIRDFNSYSFDTMLLGEGSYSIGYKYKIDNIYYADKTYSFYYHPQDFAELKFLKSGTLVNSEFPLYWRDVDLPFRIIKKANNDTLTIVKGGKKFIFKRSLFKLF
ncbi:hypothetical protein VO54_02012 [Elizabethkingia miricola]|nr:hypothetical protein VO54_02012 [Elizabethkingia miricola]